LTLEHLPESGGHRWQRLLALLSPHISATARDAYTATQRLAFDSANNSSILSCVTAARENARQVREQISSEMWEQLNELFLQARNIKLDDIWDTEPHEFFQSIKKGAHLFQGITDSTMNHGEGWHFIQVGRFIERATATAALIDAHFKAFPCEPDCELNVSDHLEWVGLLRSCTAFEAYCKVYTANLRPDRVAEFL